LGEENIDVLCISERFLNREKTLDLINGHDIIRYDRNLKQSTKHTGGGVAILTKNTLTMQLVTQKCFDHVQSQSKVEIVTGRLKGCNRTPILIACVYRPPSYKLSNVKRDVIALEMIFEELNNTHLEVIIMGDFNLGKNWSYSILENALHKANLN